MAGKLSHSTPAPLCTGSPAVAKTLLRGEERKDKGTTDIATWDTLASQTLDSNANIVPNNGGQCPWSGPLK